jgi:putative transcriptional regulator
MKRMWLQSIRKERHKTHKYVAESCGIKRQYYGMIENGDSNPSVEVAKKIGICLGFDWTIFFENIGNESLLKETNTA